MAVDLPLPPDVARVTSRRFAILRTGTTDKSVFVREIAGETPDRYFIVYQDAHGLRYHAPKKKEIIARFETRQAAYGAIEDAGKLWRQHEPKVAEARRLLVQAQKDRLRAWTGLILARSNQTEGAKA